MYPQCCHPPPTHLSGSAERCSDVHCSLSAAETNHFQISSAVLAAALPTYSVIILHDRGVDANVVASHLPWCCWCVALDHLSLLLAAERLAPWACCGFKMTYLFRSVCWNVLNVNFVHSHRSDQQSSSSQDEEEVQCRQVPQPSLATGDLFVYLICSFNSVHLNCVSSTLSFMYSTHSANQMLKTNGSKCTTSK